MADIQLHKKHSLGLAKAKAAAKKIAAQMEQEYDFKSEWNGNSLEFQRSGVKGQFVVTKDDVKIDIQLGFLLKAFKPKIEEQVKKNMNTLFV